MKPGHPENRIEKTGSFSKCCEAVTVWKLHAQTKIINEIFVGYADKESQSVNQFSKEDQDKLV